MYYAYENTSNQRSEDFENDEMVQIKNNVEISSSEERDEIKLYSESLETVLDVQPNQQQRNS